MREDPPINPGSTRKRRYPLNDMASSHTPCFHLHAHGACLYPDSVLTQRAILMLLAECCIRYR